MQRTSRLKKELDRMQKNPTAGILCWPKDDLFNLEASIVGPDGTPYENGVYQIEVQLPESTYLALTAAFGSNIYPFEPPKLRFVTPVYHPNIDTSGRICLDLLKVPPMGIWKPSYHLTAVFTAIQLLMSEPNFNDPLMTEIAEEYNLNHALYVQHARQWTEKYAIPSSSANKNCTSNVLQQKKL